MDYKYKKHIINAKTLLSKKNLSNSELKMVEQELCIADYYNDFEKDYMLYNLYGKFYLAIGDLQKAKLYFNIAINTGESDFPKASYYGLFKACIKEENYVDAEKNLALYDSCFSDKFNMVFYFKCLNKIAQFNGQKVHKLDYFVNEKGYINCVKAPKEILNLYEKAEKLFDDGEYLRAYSTIQKAQNICNNKNYPLDFMPLLNMIYKVNVLYNKKDSINIVNQIIIERLSTIDNNENKKKYLKEFVNDSKNVFAILKLIEILISEKNYSEAYLYLNHKMDAKQTQRYIKELNELRKVVNEECNHEKNNDRIEEYLIEAQEFISAGFYDKASEIYNEGYDKLQTPIFLFKLGELNYYLGNISLAKKYLVEYREKGKKYDIESCIYLGYIELIKNKNSEAKGYFEKLFEKEDISKYLKVDEEAEKVYFDMVKDKTLPEFADKDLDFKNYCNEILNSIKNGNVYRIESINKNKHNPLDIALIQIAAAPILYDMGETYLAEKYYQRAQIFIDDEAVCELSRKYEKKKNNKN